MQDIYPEVMTPERLVNEILRDLPREVLRSARGHTSAKNKICPTKSSCIGDDLEVTQEKERVDMGSTTSSSISSARATKADDKKSTITNATTAGLAVPECNDVVILDCQNQKEYHECHIRGAINVTFPAIVLRRIASGRIDLLEKLKELRAKFSNTKTIFIVYDSVKGKNVIVADGDAGGREAENAALSDDVRVVSKKLAEKGCRVATLKGGLVGFKELYPEWVVRREASTSGGHSLELGEVRVSGFGDLPSLAIQASSDNDSPKRQKIDNSLAVEIIPHLFLGNAAVSADLSILERNNIKRIVNVTPDLPNVFEGDGDIRYLRIPVLDLWAQGIGTYFPSAIKFIYEGCSKGEGVLVHCFAGISRSVTITVAYLMFKKDLSVDQAYDLVKSKKSNVFPILHFMEQLLEFEKKLK